MALATGQVLNQRYRVDQVIGQGGFGAVYRAWDVNLNAPVALKENLATSPDSVRQFQTEARLLAGLRHPNLPYVIDHFIIPEQGQYLVMEFIEGQDLQDMLNRTPGGLAEPRVLPWMEEVCKALDYLHRQSPPVIHRDIKPANIIITPQIQVRLVDFGVAKQYDPGRRTTVGARAVTEGYSPPEQYGQGGTDARSDIYSLGATLYALLTGAIPEDSLGRRTGMPLKPPSQINLSISPAIEQVILRAMRMEPERRYQSVSEFQTALTQAAPALEAFQRLEKTEEIAYAGVSSMEPVPPESLRSDSGKRWGRWMGISLAVILLCCALGVLGAGLAYFTLGTGRTDATGTQMRLALDQTSTALALLVQPTASATLPVASLTLPVPGVTMTSTDAVTLMPSNPPPSSATSTRAVTSPTMTSSPEFEYWQACPGTYLSRLRIGDQAHISQDPPLANRVREQPDTDSEILGYLQVGEELRILDGPKCAQEWVWWYIRSLETGLVGWTAEGDRDNYWLVPSR